MSINASDIGFFNSGNSIFNIGLGGEISTIPLQSSLFGDVNSQDSLQGLIDYKCVYIKNINETDYLYNFSINITDKNYSDISFGFPNTSRCLSNCQDIFIFNKEEQILNFEYDQGIQGNFELKYGAQSIYIDWDGDVNYFKSQLETGLSFLEEDFSISTENFVCINSTCNLSVVIKYSRPKKHELLSIVDISIGVGTSFKFSTFRSSMGGPINNIASSIENTKVAPKNIDGSSISFFNNKEFIIFDKLGPGEFFPIWIKRTVSPGNSGVSTDGFSFNISATNSSSLPTTTTRPPLVNILDQRQITMSNSLSCDPNKVYWQSFKAGYSGTLSNLEIGFFNPADDVAIAGQSHLRLYTGSGINNSNLIHSSSINVAILSGLFYNSYLINIPIIKDQIYTFAYFPGLVHSLAVGEGNLYVDGNLGIDTQVLNDKDLVFKIYVRTLL